MGHLNVDPVFMYGEDQLCILCEALGIFFAVRKFNYFPPVYFTMNAVVHINICLVFIRPCKIDNLFGVSGGT